MSRLNSISFLDPKNLHEKLLKDPEFSGNLANLIKSSHRLGVSILSPFTGTLYAAREFIVGTAIIFPGQAIRIVLITGKCTNYETTNDQLSISTALKCYRKACYLLEKAVEASVLIPYEYIKCVIDIIDMINSENKLNEINKKKSRKIKLDAENVINEKVEILGRIDEHDQTIQNSIERLSILEADLVELDNKIARLQKLSQDAVEGEMRLKYETKIEELMESKNNLSEKIQVIKDQAHEHILLKEHANRSILENSSLT